MVGGAVNMDANLLVRVRQALLTTSDRSTAELRRSNEGAHIVGSCFRSKVLLCTRSSVKSTQQEEARVS